VVRLPRSRSFAALRMTRELSGRASQARSEDDRHYDLWCRYFQTRRARPDALPRDLKVDVLYQRRYVFEWLDGVDAWDDVQCDA
jgi:hypothetical protein